jgi:hypothetical protein
MSNKQEIEPARPSHTVYQLTVQGALKGNWQDWFNGLLIGTELNSNDKLNTTITCKVRDQAELIGIINWLHNMNLVLEKVCSCPSGSEREDVSKNN